MEYSTDEIEHLKATHHDIGWRRGLMVGAGIIIFAGLTVMIIIV